MFADFFQWIVRRPPAGYDQAFVAEVRVVRRESLPPRATRFILIAWILIAIKHVVVIWAVHHYRVPFHQLWINAPTWLLGTMATVLYYYRE